VAHLLSPLPPEMRNDTAFMDRLHSYVPGWDFPKLNPNDHLTEHFGLVSDFLSEAWTRLRSSNRLAQLQGRVHLGGATGTQAQPLCVCPGGQLQKHFSSTFSHWPSDGLATTSSASASRQETKRIANDRPTLRTRGIMVS